MSINREMKKMRLQRKKKTRSASGAEGWEWIDGEEIDVAIYKTSDMITSASARYRESTHTGLTYCKQLKAGICRLQTSDQIFEITGCDTKPKLTNLLLKEIDTDA